MIKRVFALFALLFAFSSFAPRQLTWTAIGDSITYMNEHPEETGHRITKGYMTMVQEKRPEFSYINQGHNGWTVGGIADRIEHLGLVRSDVYSIFLGTNDWWSGRPLGKLSDYQDATGNGTVYGGYRIIVDKLRKLNPDAKIVLITPMQRVDFVYLHDKKNNAWGSYKDKNGQSLEQFANAVKEIGRLEGIKVVDLFHEKRLDLKHLVKFKRLKDPKTGEYKNYKYPDFTEIPFDPVKDEYPYPLASVDLTYDGLHPSDKGYRIISEMLLRVIGN